MLQTVPAIGALASVPSRAVQPKTPLATCYLHNQPLLHSAAEHEHGQGSRDLMARQRPGLGSTFALLVLLLCSCACASSNDSEQKSLQLQDTQSRWLDVLQNRCRVLHSVWYAPADLPEAVLLQAG